MRGIDRICVVVVLLAIAVGTAGCGDSEDEKSSAQLAPQTLAR